MSSYAPVVVSLDPLFEGTFSLSSGIGADFDEDNGIPDPLGKVAWVHAVVGSYTEFPDSYSR